MPIHLFRTGTECKNICHCVIKIGKNCFRLYKNARKQKQQMYFVFVVQSFHRVHRLWLVSADVKCLLRTMQAWRQYLDTRRAKKALYKKAEETHHRSLCRYNLCFPSIYVQIGWLWDSMIVIVHITIWEKAKTVWCKQMCLSPADVQCE